MDTTSWPEIGLELGQISTEWALIHDPGEFVLRYAGAIQRYLNALIKNRHDAEEVGQDFLMWVTAHGFPRAKRGRGRFRDYLKVAVRNAALNFLRRKRPATTSDSEVLDLLTAQGPSLIPDQEWIAQWRECLLDRAWKNLEEHQRLLPGNLYYTVLQLLVQNPGRDSTALAAEASQLVRRPIEAEAFRKQVSRARRKLAKFLVSEIAQTLDKPTPAQVEEELIDLGLIEYVRDFLPPDWHKRGKFIDSQ